MSKTPEEVLVEAINAYDYPRVTFDYLKEREHWCTSIRDLERYLQELLWATDTESVKNGLSGVLYWGHYRAGYKDDRVRKFRAAVKDAQLLQAIQSFQALRGTGLLCLRKIGLPQFSYMAFLTKLRTFLNPERYCVLDSKVASLTPLAERLKRQSTYIPVTAQNDRAYKWWIDICLSLAQRLHNQPEFRPVDIERGLFHLVDCGKRNVAERLLSSSA
jgi:hypothetical protein